MKRLSPIQLLIALLTCVLMATPLSFAQSVEEATQETSILETSEFLATGSTANTTPILHILVDSSQHMKTKYEDKKKGELFLESTPLLLDSIPDSFEVAVHTYGHRVGTRQKEKSCTDFETIHPLAEFDETALTESLTSLKQKGFASIAGSLEKLRKMLPKEEKASILIIASGKEACGLDTAAASRAFRATHPNVSIFTVNFLGDKEAQIQLNELAVASGGRAFQISRPQEAGVVFKKVLQELQRSPFSGNNKIIPRLGEGEGPASETPDDEPTTAQVIEIVREGGETSEPETESQGPIEQVTKTVNDLIVRSQADPLFLIAAGVGFGMLFILIIVLSITKRRRVKQAEAQKEEQPQTPAPTPVEPEANSKMMQPMMPTPPATPAAPQTPPAPTEDAGITINLAEPTETPQPSAPVTPPPVAPTPGPDATGVSINLNTPQPPAEGQDGGVTIDLGEPPKA